MNAPADQALSCDKFLDGRLRLFQPVSGYRAGVDPVLLAASVAAEPGQSVLDLGCGAGAALFCLAARVPGLTLNGVEVQADYAALAVQNAAENGFDAEIAHADLARLPPAFKARQFDHVIANPPYFRAGAHSSSPESGRAAAMGEFTPLPDWVETGARRLKQGGYLHLIQRADRLPEVLTACDSRLGSMEVLPLAARLARAPDRFILRARKGGRAAFRLHAPLILHDGAKHVRDAESYSTEVSAILRKAMPLIWPP